MGGHRLSLAGLGAVGCLVASCSGGHPSASGTLDGAALPAVSIEAPEPEATPTKGALVPIEEARSSSALALARYRERTIALLADEDDASLHMIDLAAGTTMTSIALPGTPAHVIVAPSGEIFVSLRSADAVQTIDVKEVNGPTLALGAKLATPAEPIGMALTRDGSALLVTSGWGQALSAHPLAKGGVRFVTPLARAPRAVLLSDDGSTAIVTHAVGSVISVVSLSHGIVTREHVTSWRDEVARPDCSDMPIANTPRFTVQAFAAARLEGRIQMPMVSVYPGEPTDGVSGYGASIKDLEPFWPEEPAVVALDTTAPRNVSPKLRMRFDVVRVDRARRSTGRALHGAYAPPCLLPRAVGVDTARKTMLVACADLGTVNEIDAGETRLFDAEHTRWHVGSGAVAIAVEATARTAWVWSQFDRTLAALSLEDPSAVKRPLSGSHVRMPSRVLRIAKRAPSNEVWEKGRIAFHSPIASDGRACASCHVDGHDDGLVWLSPDGMVQTPMLAGRLDRSGPFGWKGKSATVREHLTQTMVRLKAKQQSAETLDAIVSYATTMKAYLPPVRALSPRELRGKALFESNEVGCALCHKSGHTDGVVRTVGTGGEFATPSLRFISGTGPYLHDGRHATLRELLVGTDGKMGWTGHLDEGEMDDLIAYLKSL